MTQRNLADPKNRADREHGRAAYPLPVDIRAIGRVEVRDEQLVIRDTNHAMLARYARMRNDGVGGYRATDFQPGRTYDKALLRAVFDDAQTMKFVALGLDAYGFRCVRNCRRGLGRVAAARRCKDHVVVAWPQP